MLRSRPAFVIGCESGSWAFRALHRAASSIVDNDFNSTWLDRLKDGDQLAAERLWRAYYERLVHVARGKLRAGKRRATDEEDAALAAFDSFFRGLEQGRFPRLVDADDLWQVLVMLTARKAIDQAQHEFRQKRGGGEVSGESAWDAHGAGDFDAAGIEQVVGREPTPDFALHVAEELERRLASLGDDTLVAVALAKLEGFSNREIAETLSCGLRSVERKLALIRSIWDESAKSDRHREY